MRPDLTPDGRHVYFFENGDVTSNASRVIGERKRRVNRRQWQAESEKDRRRAVDLGEAGDAAGILELIGLCRNPAPAVRRAAASALGKMAVSERIGEAVPNLCELACDTHPQVRQYALVALGKIGDESALPVLRDAANRSSEPDYVLRAALGAIEQLIQGYAIRPDFYLPRYDVYIEYWGLDTTDYKIGMLLKQKLYQQEGKRLISLYPVDLPRLDEKLQASLKGV